MKQESRLRMRWGLATTDRKVWVLLFGICGALGGCASVEVPDNSAEQGNIEFNCAVGDVTPHEAIVWIKTSDAQTLSIQYSTDPQWSTFQETAVVSTTPETDFNAHIPLSALNPKTRYWYRSVMPGKNPSQPCQFLTAPLAEDSATITFVISGDTRHGFLPFSILETVRQVNPDFFVFLGDTIYADKETPARELSDYWSKYRENRDGFAKRLFAETSVYVMWDDHEVDSDFISTHPLLPIGRQAFFDYWPIRRQTPDSTRLYRNVRWGKAVELFLFRHPSISEPRNQYHAGNSPKRMAIGTARRLIRQF